MKRTQPGRGRAEGAQGPPLTGSSVRRGWQGCGTFQDLNTHIAAEPQRGQHWRERCWGSTTGDGDQGLTEVERPFPASSNEAFQNKLAIQAVFLLVRPSDSGLAGSLGHPLLAVVGFCTLEESADYFYSTIYWFIKTCTQPYCCASWESVCEADPLKPLCVMRFQICCLFPKLVQEREVRMEVRD